MRGLSRAGISPRNSEGAGLECCRPCKSAVMVVVRRDAATFPSIASNLSKRNRKGPRPQFWSTSSTAKRKRVAERPTTRPFALHADQQLKAGSQQAKDSRRPSFR